MWSRVNVAHFAFGLFKGSSILIVGRDEAVDGLSYLTWRSEAGSAQGAPAENAEPALNLIKPRGVRGREVEVNVAVLGQPAVVLGLVGIEVVQTRVELPLWVECHQFIHKRQEVPSATARSVSSKDLAGEHVQGGK